MLEGKEADVKTSKNEHRSRTRRRAIRTQYSVIHGHTLNPSSENRKTARVQKHRRRGGADAGFELASLSLSLYISILISLGRRGSPGASDVRHTRLELRTLPISTLHGLSADIGMIYE